MSIVRLPRRAGEALFFESTGGPHRARVWARSRVKLEVSGWRGVGAARRVMVSVAVVGAIYFEAG